MAWVRSAVVLLFGVLMLSDAPTEPSGLLVAVAAGLIGAAALVRRLLGAVGPIGRSGPAAAIHEHLRALARRGVPALRDPDAAGRTRSRAPARLLPAV